MALKNSKNNSNNILFIKTAAAAYVAADVAAYVAVAVAISVSYPVIQTNKQTTTIG